MGVDYTAVLFIGAPVPATHFYTIAQGTPRCPRHPGHTGGAYCSLCGAKTDSDVREWTEAMMAAAGAKGMTPEALWEQLSGEDIGGFCYSGQRSDRGRFGLWSFGYENDMTLLGTAVAYAGSYDRGDAVSRSVSFEDLAKQYAEISKQFEELSLALPVRIIAVNDCG